MKEEKGTQNRTQKSTRRGGGRGVLKGLISGTFITERLILNNMRYALMLAVFGIIFIANKFGAERMERQITILEQEVRDLRAESLSVSAELGGVSRQSEIIDLVKERGLGLEELREPPFRIVVNE
ncbi:MAG: FtsL-like putative cell division protein [Bacteroidales bacterium]